MHATGSGQATDDINTLSQDGSQGLLRMKGEDGTFTCSDAKPAQSGPGEIGLDSWLCRYDLPRGSMLVAAFSQYRTGTAWPSKFTGIVLGGTGAYAGVRGERVTDCTCKTFGGFDLADATAIYAGATASQAAIGTKRQVGTSASLFASSFNLPDAEGPK